MHATTAAGEALSKTGVLLASVPAGAAGTLLPCITAWSDETSEMPDSLAIRRSGKFEVGKRWRELIGPCLTAQRGVTLLRAVELII